MNATMLKEAKDRKKANKQQYRLALERKEQKEEERKRQLAALEESKRIEKEIKQQQQERQAVEAAEEERMILEYLENSHQNTWYSKSAENIKELLNDTGYKVTIRYAKELKKKNY